MAGLGNQYEIHVIHGNGVPAFTPAVTGQHYVDLANKRVYQSVGTNSNADWCGPLAALSDLNQLTLSVTKATVGLGLVENYPVATNEQATVGTSKLVYMTPSHTTLLVDTLFRPLLDDHTADTNNPHQTTAAQVGAYTKAEVGSLLAGLSGASYTKGEVDTLFAAIPAPGYTKAEVDTMFTNIPPSGYTKAEVDAMFLNVTVDAYTKAETDNLLLGVVEESGGGAGKAWVVVNTTVSTLVINDVLADHTIYNIQSSSEVTIYIDLLLDLTEHGFEVRFCNNSGFPVTFVGNNFSSNPSCLEYVLAKPGGTVIAQVLSNNRVLLSGDLEEYYFANPDFVAEQS